VGEILEGRRADIARLTRGQAALVSLYDAEDIGAALQLNGITADYLIGKLKDIMEGSDRGKQLTAVAYVLKLVAESAELSGLVAERRLVRTTTFDGAGVETKETTTLDTRAQELAGQCGRRRHAEDGEGREAGCGAGGRGGPTAEHTPPTFGKADADGAPGGGHGGGDAGDGEAPALEEPLADEDEGDEGPD